MRQLRSLDLFTGIAGFCIALGELASPVAYCDNSVDAQNILKARILDERLPNAPILTDVRKITPDMLKTNVDIITAGFPCQDVSRVGVNLAARSGSSGLLKDRSGLILEVIRLTRELRPALVFLENVTMVTRDPAYPAMLRAFAAAGYKARWDQFNAASLGFEHRRDRWFMLLVRDDKLGNQKLSELAKAIGSFTQIHEHRTETPLMMHDAGNGGSHAIRRRLEALGNSLVPDVARYALHALVKDHLQQRHFTVNPENVQSLAAGSLSTCGKITPCNPNKLLRVHPNTKPLIFLPDADATLHRSGGGRGSIRRKLEGGTQNQWATPRHGVRLGVKSITERTQNDLPVQLTYWNKTPKRLREAALSRPFKASASPRFVENLMGYPPDWTRV